MTIRTIQHNSKEYEQMIELRIKVLLNPIGVPAHYIVPEKEKDDFFIAAFEGDNMVGCCVLTPRENGPIQLRQMAVHSSMQGKRIGAAIIQFAEETAKQNGFDLLLLHARNPVIDFYKKCGYQIAGDEFFEVGIGHHIMQKRIKG
jgi:N-acetylglutamate synthase-like GNAT family acetyltransferase